MLVGWLLKNNIPILNNNAETRRTWEIKTVQGVLVHDVKLTGGADELRRDFILESGPW